MDTQSKILEVVLELNDKLGPELKRSATKTKRDLAGMQKQAKATNQQFAALKATALSLAKGLGALYVIREVNRYMREGLVLAGNYAQGLRALGVQVRGLDISSKELIETLQKQTNYQVAQVDLIASTNRAVALLGRESIPKFEELADVATRAAKVMGIDVTQAFNDIVTGIGRESRMILDNLGIIVSAEKAYSNYAAQLGKAAGALTDIEKKQAFLNEALEQGRQKYGEIVKNTGDYKDEAEKLKAKLKDTHTELSTRWMPIQYAWNQMLLETLKHLTDVGYRTDEWRKSIIGLKQSLGISLSRGDLSWITGKVRESKYGKYDKLTYEDIYGTGYGSVIPGAGTTKGGWDPIGGVYKGKGGGKSSPRGTPDDPVHVLFDLAGFARTGGIYRRPGKFVGGRYMPWGEDDTGLMGLLGATGVGLGVGIAGIKRLLGIGRTALPPGGYTRWATGGGRHAPLGVTGLGFDFTNLPPMPRGGGYGSMGDLRDMMPQIAMAGAAGGVSGGGRGAIAGMLPMLGGAVGGPWGMAVGGILSAIIGKPKQRGNTATQPVFVSVVNAGDIAIALLNITKSGLAAGASTLINSISMDLRMQAQRLGV